MKILVLLASFLDSELPYTIKSCIENAAHPDNIRFAVILQHDYNDQNIIDNLPYDIVMEKYHYKESEGCGWARNKVSELYNNEEYVLQIDSHTRLAKNWDIDLVQQLEELGPNAIISFLPPSYIKNDDGTTFYANKDRPTFIQVPEAKSFVVDYVVFHRAELEKDTEYKNQRVAFMQCGFIFAPGQWLKDVPPDPVMYYWGEEQSIFLRSFTQGYDVYLPKQIVAWHFSSNNPSPHHWKVNEESRVHHLSNNAYQRSKELITGELKGKYGLGSVRSMDDWLQFTGIDYFNKTII
jgi:hypothetical protein